MRLSTKGKYALEALLFLGYSSSDGVEPISLNAISHETGVSIGYLEQLFRVIKKNGIVKSIKGKYGGYSLAKPADEITVGEILTFMEGPLSLVKCTEDEICERRSECLTHGLWKAGYEKIVRTVYAITLQQLIDDYRSRIERMDAI